jgi:hypothetical protein
MRPATPCPAAQPTTGIKNWKKPKLNDMRSSCAVRTWQSLMEEPIATALASMAKPTASVNIIAMVTNFFPSLKN